MNPRGSLRFGKKQEKASGPGLQISSVKVDRDQINLELVPNEKQERSKLDHLIEKSIDSLLKVSSIFPFDLFPDDVIIDTQKINIVFRYFLWSERIHSIMIKDISDVFVETGIFFATLRIIDRGFIENSIDVPYLWNSDALKARRAVQGLMIICEQKIDLTKFSSEEIYEKIQKLGEARHNPPS